MVLVSVKVEVRGLVKAVRQGSRCGSAEIIVNVYEATVAHGQLRRMGRALVAR